MKTPYVRREIIARFSAGNCFFFIKRQNKVITKRNYTNLQMMMYANIYTCHCNQLTIHSESWPALRMFFPQLLHFLGVLDLISLGFSRDENFLGNIVLMINYKRKYIHKT